MFEIFFCVIVVIFLDCVVILEIVVEFVEELYGFMYCKKVFDLFWFLCICYWIVFVRGESDMIVC